MWRWVNLQVSIVWMQPVNFFLKSYEVSILSIQFTNLFLALWKVAKVRLTDCCNGFCEWHNLFGLVHRSVGTDLVAFLAHQRLRLGRGMPRHQLFRDDIFGIMCICLFNNNHGTWTEIVTQPPCFFRFFGNRSSRLETQRKRSYDMKNLAKTFCAMQAWSCIIHWRGKLCLFDFILVLWPCSEVRSLNRLRWASVALVACLCGAYGELYHMLRART